jgi:type IV pilus assembly protein PilE
MVARRIRRPGGRSSGFTLIELCIVLALVGVLAALAWPSLLDHLARGRRADGVAALIKLQMAQEGFRAHHGLYAARLAQLGGAAAPVSAGGAYHIALLGDGGSDYEARATARSSGAIADDRECPVLILRVRDGLAEYAPTARCWNR